MNEPDSSFVMLELYTSELKDIIYISLNKGYNVIKKPRCHIGLGFENKNTYTLG